MLFQSFFSVAGPASRANQSLVTLLPFATVRIAGAWFLKWPEAPWQFDLQRGSSLIPLGLGVGRIVTFDSQVVLVSISDETAVVHANVPNAPKNTVRVTFTILVRSDTQ